MEKRGISDLVATVLLILITIVAVGVIYYWLMGWIRTSTETAKICNDALLEVKTEEGYTCYNDAQVQIQVKRGPADVQIEGIQLLISGDGASKTFDIKSGSTVPGAGMYNSNSSTLEIPGQNEALTYVIKRDSMKMTKVNNVAAASLVKIGDKETLCSMPPSTAISSCGSF